MVSNRKTNVLMKNQTTMADCFTNKYELRLTPRAMIILCSVGEMKYEVPGNNVRACTCRYYNSKQGRSGTPHVLPFEAFFPFCYLSHPSRIVTTMITWYNSHQGVFVSSRATIHLSRTSGENYKQSAAKLYWSILMHYCQIKERIAVYIDTFCTSVQFSRVYFFL